MKLVNEELHCMLFFSFLVITANLAKQHASRVQRFEERMCSQLEERHKVFEAAFQQQMKNYRTLGRMPGERLK